MAVTLAMTMPSVAHATNVVDLAFGGTFTIGPSPFSGQSLAAHVVYDADSPLLGRNNIGQNHEILSFDSPSLYVLTIGGVVYTLHDTYSLTTQTTYYNLNDGKRFFHSELAGRMGDPGDYRYFVRLFSDGYGFGNSPIQPADIVSQQNGALVLNFSIASCTNPSCDNYYVPEHTVESTVLVYSQNVTVTPVTSDAPEPSIWAMLIAGFAFIGGIMRRRQRAMVRDRLDRWANNKASSA